MEKEQILSTINEKLGQTSLSQRTLCDYVDRNLPAEGVEPDDAYWNKHVEILKSLGGNFSADVAAQVSDFKKNYKPETHKSETHENSGEIGDLKQQIEDLKKLFGEQRTRTAADNIRKDVLGRGDSLKVANKAIWEDAVKSVEIGEKDSESDITARAKNAYEKMLKRYMGDGASPYGSSGRQGATKESEEAAKEKREALKNKMQARGRLPKSE